MKKIKFYPADESISHFGMEPKPAKNIVPDWWKKIPKYWHPEVAREDMETHDLTIKSCIPVVDSLTSGYMFLLATDLKVERKNDGTPSIKWIEYDAMNSPVIKRSTSFTPLKDRYSDPAMLPKFEKYDNLMFNWNEFWGLKTPKGYSCISMHPLNRLDLPFYTLGGIINTDKWGVNGNHPFILKEGWEGIIPAGTPIIQIIPFKRESWKSKIDRSIYRYDGNCLEEESKVKRHYYRDFLWDPPKYE